jgi:hypothetical protein
MFFGFAALIFGVLTIISFMISPVQAFNTRKIPNPQPIPGSYGLAAIKNQPPPTTTATITSPGNGSSFTTNPVTVSGICTKSLLVQVYDNGVLVGAIDCKTGSFSIQVTLFPGKNVLSTIQYDDLNQAGPQGNSVTVSFNNSHLQPFGNAITLTSDFGRRAANPGDALSWPLQLSGGTGPYAFSINWGDGTKAQLMAVSLAGVVNISHVYNQSGVYHVTISVVDSKGVSAFLQVVAVANGKPLDSGTGGNTQNTNTRIIYRIVWIPAVATVVLLLPAYWFGRRSELRTLRKQLEQDLSRYNEF